MKLTKKEILEVNKISMIDADIRLENFDKYKNLEPDNDLYDYDRMKEYWQEGKYFDIENVEGWYGNYKGKFTIIFRGADGLKDWLSTLLIFRKVVPYADKGTNKKIKVHSGFLKDYMKVRDFLHTKFKESKMKAYMIHGHSKGACLAELCALDFAVNFKDKLKYGFATGSPRLGNKYFVESFDKHLPYFASFEFESDLIPQLPFKFLGFRHLSNFIHIGKKRRFGIGSKKQHFWNFYFDALTSDLEDNIVYC